MALPDSISGVASCEEFFIEVFFSFCYNYHSKRNYPESGFVAFGSTPKVWEFFYQHVGAGSVLDVEAGDFASVTCVDMMLRAPEDSEVSMRISGYAATSKVRLHHHWQTRYLPVVMFFL